ncbi:MAG: hypothetical protein HY827_03450 [Actinobacteria bacterium]|nr:hypothetical protein [Actinomycetota bacterium]
MLIGLLQAVGGYNEPAPTWLPVVVFLVPAVIVVAVLIPALRSRKRSGAAQRQQRRGRQSADTRLGSATEIDDCAPYSTDALLKAMAIKPEDHGPGGGQPHDEGWAGTMLGLKSKISYATVVLEPHVYWGERPCGQVFIRVGPDEKLEGGTMMGTNRHVRQITVLRVAAPVFDLEVRDGRPTATADSDLSIAGALASLSQDEVVWQDLRVHGGADGIVVHRGAITAPGFWIYDLWLAERIAGALTLEALPAARIGPAWKVPYGLGRAFEPSTSA